MLQIKDIRKKYVTGDLVQTALDGVSLTLRDNEFVAILGPSGSGKTTLLNVIGGLDRYDSGDLVINGISTKNYSDRDWDSYRNHTIGFVFQSYNLIPHQTVLANVELALTISGISRSERRKRAIKALEEVGLGNQLHKKPNQMSGGQMQRVAIARALVNNPDILLADEPTGALDSDTSVQVMELLKEVSKDRLVVMVTHNPELAEEYANRIVRVRDGRIIDDTNPCESTEDEAPQHKNMGRSSMSFWTALSLSFNNLKTKKGRTILTAFAGSIGIIGIALILSLSTGFQRYIDQIQEETLSNYPLTIQSESADMTAALAAFSTARAEAEENDEGIVSEQQMISQMFAQVGSNDLGEFKKYLEEHYDEVEEQVNTIQYGYGVKPQIYLADTSNGVVQVNPGTLFGELTGSSMMSAYMDTDIFQEMIDAPEMLEAQYDVLQGHWPENYNEMVLVLQEPHSMTDYMSYTLGIRDANELKDMIMKVMNGEEPELDTVAMEWTYDDLMALEYKLVTASDLYKYNDEYEVWEDMSKDKTYMKELIEQSEPLRIVGVVCPKDGVTSTSLMPGVAYTTALTEYVIELAESMDIVKDQLENKDIDVFTGKEFGSEEEETGLNFEDMITIDESKITAAFGGGISESDISSMVERYMTEIAGSFAADPAVAQEDFLGVFRSLFADMMNSYISANADPATGMAELQLSSVDSMVTDYLASDSALSIMGSLTAQYMIPTDAFVQVYAPLLKTAVASYAAMSSVPGTGMPDAGAVPGETPEEPAVGEVMALTETSDLESSVPEVGEPETSTPDSSLPESSTPEGSIPDTSIPEEIPGAGTPNVSLYISAAGIDAFSTEFSSNALVTGVAATMADKMTGVIIQKNVMAKVMEYTTTLMTTISNAMDFDQDALASAFQFNMDQDEITRLMEAMTSGSKERSADTNLKSLGYADTAEPTLIEVYLIDFESKELFMDFIDDYNDKMLEAEKEELVISYTDVTGIMMSSVRTIVDSVSYVLIAFVAVSLIVSSIMIGIITYISVMERTKEIGVLRAIGASKRNISQVFNAETFIIGLCSGAMGVGISLLLLIPINAVIHSLTGITSITAQLPVVNAITLVVLSVALTLIGGLIPSKKAALKDPVIALRSE